MSGTTELSLIKIDAFLFIPQTHGIHSLSLIDAKPGPVKGERSTACTCCFLHKVIRQNSKYTKLSSHGTVHVTRVYSRNNIPARLLQNVGNVGEKKKNISIYTFAV